LIVAYRNGAPVRLDEVAHVIDSVEDNRQTALLYGEKFGDKGKLGGDADHLAAAWQHTFEVWIRSARFCRNCRKLVRRAVHLIVRRRGRRISRNVQDIQTTMLATLGLVILVIFVFLRKISATLIPRWRCPISIMGTSP